MKNILNTMKSEAGYYGAESIVWLLLIVIVVLVLLKVLVGVA